MVEQWVKRAGQFVSFGAITHGPGGPGKSERKTVSKAELKRLFPEVCARSRTWKRDQSELRGDR